MIISQVAITPGRLQSFENRGGNELEYIETFVYCVHKISCHWPQVRTLYLKPWECAQTILVNISCLKLLNNLTCKSIKHTRYVRAIDPMAGAVSNSIYF